jgi:hypothetical protein
MSTLETGAGASTIVFAAGGARHVAISPAPAEHERLTEYCAAEGIDLSRVTFIAESSPAALAQTWEPSPLDLALIDGAHSFPFPMLDWYYVAPHIKVGGHVIVDDAFIPSVNVLVRYLRASDAWQLVLTLANRTLVFRKLRDEEPTWEWSESRFDRRPKFDYLPPVRRLEAWAHNLLYLRSPFEAIVRRSVARRGRRF